MGRRSGETSVVIRAVLERGSVWVCIGSYLPGGGTSLTENLYLFPKSILLFKFPNTALSASYDPGGGPVSAGFNCLETRSTLLLASAFDLGLVCFSAVSGLYCPGAGF